MPQGMGGGFDMTDWGRYWHDLAMQWPALFPEPLPVAPIPVEFKSSWPAEARALARDLLRTDAVAAKNGLRIEIDECSFDTRWGELSSRSQALVLLAPSAWLVRAKSDDWNNVDYWSRSPTWGLARGLFGLTSWVNVAPPWGAGTRFHDDQTKVAWCDAREIGAFSKDLLLGTVRQSRSGDVGRLTADLGNGTPLDLGEGAIRPLDQSYPIFRQITPQAGGQVWLVAGAYPGPREYRILIDTRRKVVVKVEQRNEGRLVATTTSGDFVQVAGAWFAGRIETTDAQGRQTSLVTQTITALGPGDLDRQWKAELADRDRAQLVRTPLPDLAKARRAAAAGKTTFEDEIALFLHFQQSQQWGRALEHFEKAEKLSGKPGMRWVRYNLLLLCRRHEELKKCFFDEAARIARAGGDRAFPADSILGPASCSLEADEMLALLDLLRPVYERLPAELQGMKTWTERRIDCLDRVERTADVERLRKQLAEQFPHDCDCQTRYLYDLLGRGEDEAAAVWLDRLLGPGARWTPQEEGTLRNVRIATLDSDGRSAELSDYLAAWIAQNPRLPAPYERYVGELLRTAACNRPRA